MLVGHIREIIPFFVKKFNVLQAEQPIFSTIILFIFLGANSFWLLIVAVLILGLFDHYFRSMYFGIMLWWLVLAIGYKK
ncbi:hypothetical protein HOC73_03485 [bacterium]|nr:hypothetical protein [bacterium]